MELYPFDDAYVARLCAGDRFTLDHFHRYFTERMQMKMRSRRFRGDADDVQQEVFFRVYRGVCSGEGIRDGTRFGAYVNTVHEYVMQERFRANGRTEELGDEHDVPDKAESMEQVLLSREEQTIVRDVLKRLPRRDRDLLTALFLEERDKDEICREFSVDKNYLRVLLHRARDKFRSEYGSKDATPIRAAETVPRKPVPSPKAPGGSTSPEGTSTPPTETDSGKPSLSQREPEDGPHRSR